MSLRRRTLLIVSASLLGVILLVFVAAHAVLLNGYRTLEKQSLSNYVESLNYLLDFQAQRFVDQMGTYAESREAAAFTQGGARDYPQDVLTEEFFSSNELSQLYMVDTNRTVLYSDGIAETLLPGLESSLLATDPLFEQNSASSQSVGYIRLDDEVFLVASRPIVAPQDTQTILGTMLWVRRMNPDTIAWPALLQDGGIEWFSDEDDIDAELREIRSQLESGTDYVEQVSKQQITAYIRVPGIPGLEPIILAIHQNRDVLIEAEQRFLLLGIALTFVTAGFGLITALLLERMGTARSISLQHQLKQIMETGAFHNRLHLNGEDHLASLTRSINRLIALYDQKHQDHQKSESERDALISTLPLALLRLNEKGQWLHGVGRALENFEINPETAVNKPLAEVFPLAQGLREVVEQTLRGERIHQMLNLTPNVSAEGWFIPLWERGGITGVNVVLLSRTAFVRLERELEEAKEAAEAAHNAKATFLANMSHELRTPLNAIIGFTGIMMMSRGPDDKDLYRMERIRANGERLLELIDDILDLSRIEAGRMILIPIEVNVRETVSLLTSRYERDAREKGLKFNTRIRPSVPDILLVDQDALEKIIRNLVSNAVKFTDEGEVRLELTVESNDLIITVTDTGIGIPPHMHEIIFESFRQVDPSATRAYGGTGLGLSLVHNLCLALGGKIRLESASEQGTTFTVTLPLIAQESRV